MKFFDSSVLGDGTGAGEYNDEGSGGWGGGRWMDGHSDGLGMRNFSI